MLKTKGKIAGKHQEVKNFLCTFGNDYILHPALSVVAYIKALQTFSWKKNIKFFKQLDY